jgi:hypothetical protein
MMKSRILLISAILLLASSTACGKGASPAAASTAATATPQPEFTPPPDHFSSNVKVFATGLNNPRGLKFGPDGDLYVAEGGVGGTNTTTAAQCDQVPAPVGPYSGGPDGSRISKFDSNGNRTTVIDHLPSSQTTAAAGGFVSGAADVAWVGEALYALLAGAGCSHGVPDVPNGVMRVNADGTWTKFADLGAFQKAHPVKAPEADDFEPDGTWYSMVEHGDEALFVLEPNHGEIDRIWADGSVKRIVDISATEGHIVPTAMVIGNDGTYYVGNLGTFPANSDSKILKITTNGDITEMAKGLTAVTGLAFDAQGNLYALEASAPVTDPQGPPVAPGTGRVVLVRSDATLEPIATGLNFPTAMTYGPDGKLYVSNNGFGMAPGQGEIVEITIEPQP